MGGSAKTGGTSKRDKTRKDRLEKFMCLATLRFSPLKKSDFQL